MTIEQSWRIFRYVVPALIIVETALSLVLVRAKVFWEVRALVVLIVAAIVLVASLSVLPLLNRLRQARDLWLRVQHENLEAILTTHVGSKDQEEIRKKFTTSNGYLLSRSESFRFYGEIVDVATASGLLALGSFLRDNLKRFAPAQMTAYEVDFPRLGKDASEDELRADAKRLICLVAHAWQGKLENETMRAVLATATATLTIAITLSFLIWLTLGISAREASILAPPLLVAALFAGTLGGFVSVQHRLHGAPAETVPLAESPRLAVTSIITAPVLGAIGALLVYVIMSGGLLSGALFPQFEEVKKPKGKVAEIGPTSEVEMGEPEASTRKAQPTEVKGKKENIVSFVSYVTTDSVKQNSDLAKLLFWCFVAGFLERFVPDTITSLLGKSAGQVQSKPPSG